MARDYWTDAQHVQLTTATTYHELFMVAREVLKVLPKPIGQVCGPISTGGAGSIEKNIYRLNEAIAELQKKGVMVFDQTPFEDPMQRIKALRERELNGEYDTAILTDFYLPIFEGKYIHRCYFLPDWESSFGAQWEHEQAQRCEISITYL